ncbi:hypothetical protein [Sphaerisporangium aureirubrum]|uniref:Acyltransferase n=1 Tax=Sphaerisporangium aureirubrum TaxID=1544736 RepID=A0ABW1NXH2_9ACTN
MSLLEDRYRHVLRLLPASYRAGREEEMVAAFLEGAGGLTDRDNPRPRWSEIASVAALSVRVRLAGTPAVPRYHAWGRAVRLAALLGLFFHATLSCLWFAGFLNTYALRDLLGIDVPGALGTTMPLDAGSAERLLDIVWGFTCLFGLAAFAALTRGRPAAAKVLAVLALLSVCGATLRLLYVLGPFAFETITTHILVFGPPVLALFAGFHRDARPPRRPAWVAALPVAAGLALYAGLSALSVVTDSSVDDTGAWAWPWMDEPGLALLALLAAAAYAATRPRTPGGRDAALPLALALLTLPLAAARSMVFLHLSGPPVLGVTYTVQLGALLLCGVAMLVMAARAMPAREPVQGPEAEVFRP